MHVVVLIVVDDYCSRCRCCLFVVALLLTGSPESTMILVSRAGILPLSPLDLTPTPSPKKKKKNRVISFREHGNIILLLLYP